MCHLVRAGELGGARVGADDSFVGLAAEDMEQIMVDSPSGVIPPEQIIGMLHERGALLSFLAQSGRS